MICGVHHAISGTGLATDKRIIEVHGGKIRVESEGPGMGSTFRFPLPVVPDEGGSANS